jgi:RNA polymerase sigma-70 factor (ECF subfamily)
VPPRPKIVDAELWDGLIRAHDHRVRVSLLALGLRPEEAREVAQMTWLALMEKHAGGRLEELALPGLAVAQARFLALDLLRREDAERRRAERAAAQGAIGEDVIPDGRLAGRDLLDRVASVLASGPKTARTVFLLIHGRGLAPAEVARQLGLSVQRVRQILCETRKRIRAALPELEEGER